MTLYRPVRIGSLTLKGNLFLAPVAGYSDRAFRFLCVEQGANFTFTELVSAEALYRNPGRYGLGACYRAESAQNRGFPLLSGSMSGTAPGADASKQAVVPQALNLVSRADNEHHYGIQLFGEDPPAIYKAAVLLAPLKPAALDINSGCPVHKVVKNGAGSALMKDPAKLGRVVEAAVKASREALGDIPVTIKMRSGWDSASINYFECAHAAVEAGAAMISLHPRTRSQNYGGKSDWNCIADLAGRLKVPVSGSGDLYTPEDAERMLRETGCAALMFARGAMGNPFIFSATRSLLETGTWEGVSFRTRIETGLRHLELLAAGIGERSACLEMRKHFCCYTKTKGNSPGMAKGASLRNALVHAQTIEEYRQIVAEY